MKKLFMALLLLSATAFAQSDFRTTGTLTASSTDCSTAGSCASVAVANYSQVAVTVSGTYAGVTIVFEFSDDGGTTWFQDTCTRTDAAVSEGSEALPTNQTRAWDCGVSASTNFRVRASAYSSGTVTVGLTRTAVQIEPAPTVQLTVPVTSFAVVSNPAANSQATASQAAGGAGVRNVATLVCFSAGSVVAPALTALTINLRDGATGAGTIKWTHQLIIGAATGQNVGPFCTPVNIIGSANTAMTLEFSAGLTSLSEAVSLQGYTTTF